MTNAIFGIVGVIIGGFLGHWLSRVRDRDARRRAFLGFLEQWKSEISAPNRGPTQIGVHVDSGILAYDKRLGDFRSHVAIARDAFVENPKFDSLTIRLGGLKPQDWNQKSARDVIIDAIERLIESCKP